jgi:16S rRNA (cytidine1402-2'-O)-methyltransferase
VAVARELTKLHEEFVRGTLREAIAYYREHPPKGEVTVVVAPAAEAEATSAHGDLELEARGLAARLLAGGKKPSAAAKELTARLDLARNDAYRVVQESLRPSDRAVPEPPA